MTGKTLELLSDENMLLLFGKGICGGICNAISKHAKTNNKYMKSYDSNKESTYFMYVDGNKLYGYAMCEKLLDGNFKWVYDLSIFTEDFIKSYNENSVTRYLLLVDVVYLKIFSKNISICHFYLIKLKLIRLVS